MLFVPVLEPVLVLVLEPVLVLVLVLEQEPVLVLVLEPVLEPEPDGLQVGLPQAAAVPSLYRQSHAPRCPSDSQMQRRRPYQHPTLHTRASCRGSGRAIL